MSFFVIMKDHVLSLTEVLGLNANSSISSFDSSMKVLR